MLVSFFFWISTVLLQFANAAANIPQVAAMSYANQSYTTEPPADSLTYKVLNEKLLRFQKERSPEKIYLHLDRTLLEPDATLWFTAYIRNAGNLRPADKSEILYVTLRNPQGNTIQEKQILVYDGVAAGEFYFHENLPGGEYTISARTNWMRNTGEQFERKITLQKTILPNLNFTADFLRKGYGPGDMVTLRLDIQTLENQPLIHKKIQYSTALNGAETSAGEAETDANGRVYIRTELPKDLATTDGSISVVVEHLGKTESIARPIPIVLNAIDLQFFPEGGDAVAGLPCNMAFKAINEFGKPADVEGIVQDAQGNTVAQFNSYHDGMGAFDWLPANQHYTAQITRPTGINKVYELPAVQPNGYSLRIQDKTDAQVPVHIAATQAGQVYLTAMAQDKLFFFKSLALNGREDQTLVIPVGDLPPGIVRITLFDSQHTELAERLIFVGRERGLQVQVRTDKQQYLPRERVQVQVDVRDHSGMPVQGQFSMAVCDERLLSFADDRQGHILASMLLEQDVRGTINEPNFYFDAQEPKSAQAMDYLLMTQGWRRFEWKQVFENEPFAAQYPGEKVTEITGRLITRNCKPIKNALIQLNPNGPKTRTDANGYYKFEGKNLIQYSYIDYPESYSNPYPIEYGRQNIILYGIENPRIEGSYTVSHENAGASKDAAAKTVCTGTISDEVEPLIGASIQVLKNNGFVTSGISDVRGGFRFNIAPGTYDMQVSYTGYQTLLIKNIDVLSEKINRVDVKLGTTGNILEGINVFGQKITSDRKVSYSIISSTTQDKSSKRKKEQKRRAEQQAESFGIREFKVPLIKQDQTLAGKSLTSDKIRNLPARGVNAILATTAGTSSLDGGAVTIKGSRSNTTNYYMDGIRVTGQMPPVQDNDFPPRFARARDFYVPQYDQPTEQTTRNDFRATIYWNPNIQTDKTGHADFTFFTSDAITNFRATVEGISTKGIATHAQKQVFVQKPVHIDLKIPPYVLAGDTLVLQIGLNNHTGYNANGALSVQVPAHFTLIGQIPRNAMVAPGQTRIIAAKYLIGQPVADTPEQDIQVRFTGAESFEDVINLPIKTLERGFPIRQVNGAKAEHAYFDVHLQQPVAGSVSAKITAYPSQLTDLLGSMERMLRQPSGCFEQVSSSNYPNLLVLDLLRSTQQVKPETEAKALDYLQQGYEKLTGYECKTGGFDWYGRDPGHEGLTAYGILEFRDMSNVFPVDEKMIQRSVNWLLSRRDGQGGWQTNSKALHSWSNNTLGAYIAWAVTEAGYATQFTPEIDSAYQRAIRNNDPYELALMANVMAIADRDRAAQLIDLLRPLQIANGAWQGKTTSITSSTGTALDIETTALVLTALLKIYPNEYAIEKGVQFLAASKNQYGFGNTQSTVLALRALVAYSKSIKNFEASGSFDILVDGKHITSVHFSPKEDKPFEIQGLEQYFTGTQHQVEVVFKSEKIVIPVDFELQYASRQPLNNPNCPLAFTTALSVQTVQAGNTVRLSAHLKNTTGEALASPMIVLGLPAGLSLQPWQLKQIMAEKRCDFYEIWDGNIVFHFEQIGAHETRELYLDLKADITGTFEPPANQAFLYYQNEYRVWSKPERVQVE